MVAALEECRWCGEVHGPYCQIVKALEFGPGGNVTRVEFVTLADFPRQTEAADDGADKANTEQTYETYRSMRGE